jgi:aminoglycoside phosphotransferase (APT) family kinase protein
MDEHNLPDAAHPLHAKLLTGGQANLVYRLCRGGHDLVLRRPPMNAPAGRDQTMHREYTVLAALAHTDVPHSPVHALCTDPDVLGASFYIMDFVRGWSPASCGDIALGLAARAGALAAQHA